MEAVTSEQVAAYLPLVERLAPRFVGFGRSGAELDDLVQEGLIDVWLTLRRGQIPSAEYILHRMKRWCDFLSKQEPGDYDTEMLPLDENATDANSPEGAWLQFADEYALI